MRKISLFILTIGCLSCIQGAPEGGFPASCLPEHITTLTSLGESAE